MSTAEMIFKMANALPEPLQTEALHYLDFLVSRQSAKADASEWARLSASQLEKHYASTDAIYDQD